MNSTIDKKDKKDKGIDAEVISLAILQKKFPSPDYQTFPNVGFKRLIGKDHPADIAATAEWDALIRRFGEKISLTSLQRVLSYIVVETKAGSFKAFLTNLLKKLRSMPREEATIETSAGNVNSLKIEQLLYILHTDMPTIDMLKEVKFLGPLMFVGQLLRQYWYGENIPFTVSAKRIVFTNTTELQEMYRGYIAKFVDPLRSGFVEVTLARNGELVTRTANIIDVFEQYLSGDLSQICFSHTFEAAMANFANLVSENVIQVHQIPTNSYYKGVITDLTVNWADLNNATFLLTLIRMELGLVSDADAQVGFFKPFKDTKKQGAVLTVLPEFLHQMPAFVARAGMNVPAFFRDFLISQLEIKGVPSHKVFPPKNFLITVPLDSALQLISEEGMISSGKDVAKNPFATRSIANGLSYKPDYKAPLQLFDVNGAVVKLEKNGRIVRILLRADRTIEFISGVKLNPGRIHFFGENDEIAFTTVGDGIIVEEL